MRGISETYYQNGWGSCTAMASTHSMKSQNEVEYRKKIELDRKDIRTKMGHDLWNKKDSWDSTENAVSMVVKKWIKGIKDWQEYLYQSDLRCYWKRDSRQQWLALFPLVVIIKWNKKTWEEMLEWEVKTIGKFRDWHAILLAGKDLNKRYFYNSFGDKVNKGWISNFFMTKENFEKAIEIWMISWRWFWLVDKKDCIDYVKEIEISKQVISPLKKLYDIGDDEVKRKLEECWLTARLENKFSFKF